MTAAKSNVAPSIASGATADAQILCLAVVPKVQYNAFPLYWLAVPKHIELDERFANGLKDILCDELQENLWICSPSDRKDWATAWTQMGFRWWAERQFQPGVTDNLSHTVEEALDLKGFKNIKVASGNGFLFQEAAVQELIELSAAEIGNINLDNAARFLEHKSLYEIYHPLTDKFKVHDLGTGAAVDEFLSFPRVTLPAAPIVQTVNLDLGDSELEKLSRDRLLALTLAEMKVVRAYFQNPKTIDARKFKGLTALPTDVELEVIAQTWSEHCKHKIFNATISHTYTSLAGKKTEQIKSLYKTYIQAPTKKMMGGTRKDLLSVFEDNSGVVKWNDQWAVCFKVETHNSPSALEPYGGALTGILGVNRDILGTGIGARPIFNTDVFCFAHPSPDLPVRPKLLPPETIMNGVRRGVEDGGNKSGIPTVNGALYFDRRYRAKPLVFCGTGGILPLEVAGKIAYQKHTKPGDKIIVAGGRVGKDGVHGATFSSESLHEGSPVSAVQIGDPFTQKRLLDFVIEARDRGLISGITDNGAGGLSSSVGEMAQFTNGATIDLTNMPLKYPGLSDWEIVISESQERMTISTKYLSELKKVADKHHVEITEIGAFNTDGYFEINRGDRTVAYLELAFLHGGLPPLELEAEGRQSQITMTTGAAPSDPKTVLLKLLAHPNICSKEQVIRRYDHEVQAMSVIKPLMGPRQMAPCDAAVLLPIPGEKEGLVVSNGLSPRLSEHDAYVMAVCAVDEAVRNAVCVGADPNSITVLDNFCWPDPVHTAKNPNGKTYLSQLVRACQGLHDAVTAFGTPLISGKDSMKNDFDDGVVRLSIPPTLLVSAMGKVENIEACVSMDFKRPGDLVYLLSAGRVGLAGSHYEELSGWQSSLLPALDLNKACQLYRSLHDAMKHGLIESAHDLSEGGLSVALAESIIGSGLGCEIDLNVLAKTTLAEEEFITKVDKLLTRADVLLFAEGPGRILISIAPENASKFESQMTGSDFRRIGVVNDTRTLSVRDHAYSFTLDVSELEKAWRTRLPFD